MQPSLDKQEIARNCLNCNKMLFLTMCQGNYKLNVCKQGNVFAEDAMINKQEMQLIFAMLEEIKTKICIIHAWNDFTCSTTDS